MIARQLQDYLDLVTTEHRDKPLFIGVLSAAIGGNQASADVLRSMLQAFDIDHAVGQQLDILGIWVGRNRQIATPLPNVFFSWDGNANVGWDAGLWKGQFDPVSGLVELPDEEYRRLLKTKIAANAWDGSIHSAQEIWDALFDDQQIIIQDNQDMSMMVGFVGQPMTPVQQALLTGGYFPLKPAGVRIKFYAVPVNTGPLFAWDASSDQLRGWDMGSWPLEISPS